MSRPKAYSPEYGYKYQILCRNSGSGQKEWEHCDYAKDSQECGYLTGEYSMAYGAGWEFRRVSLPRKYWKEAVK